MNDVKERNWNLRYVCYAASNGNLPGVQLELDAKEYPGGKMVPFSLWINTQWTLFGNAFPHYSRKVDRSSEQQQAFDNYLMEKFPCVEKT